MERIPSKLGRDWWNETLTRGMNLKKHFTIVFFAVRRRPEVCCLYLVTVVENMSVQFVFWSLGPLSKTCLLQKRLPLSAVKAMVIFHVRCTYVSSESNIFSFFITHSMHSLKDTEFWLCYFLFIVPVVINDFKLCNHQFIAPSLYNQITQLIFITDIVRPKIKCTTLFSGTLFLCEVSRFLSKLLTDYATAAK